MRFALLSSSGPTHIGRHNFRNFILNPFPYPGHTTLRQQRSRVGRRVDLAVPAVSLVGSPAEPARVARALGHSVGPWVKVDNLLGSDEATAVDLALGDPNGTRNRGREGGAAVAADLGQELSGLMDITGAIVGACPDHGLGGGIDVPADAITRGARVLGGGELHLRGGDCRSGSLGSLGGLRFGTAGTVDVDHDGLVNRRGLCGGRDLLFDDLLNDIRRRRGAAGAGVAAGDADRSRDAGIQEVAHSKDDGGDEQPLENPTCDVHVSPFRDENLALSLWDGQFKKHNTI